MIAGVSVQRVALGGLGRGGQRRQVWAWTAVVWVVLGGGALALAQSELIPPGPGVRPPLGGPYPGFVLTLVAGVLFVISAPALVRAEVFDRHWWKRSRAMDGGRRRALARCVRAVRPVPQAQGDEAVVVARAMLYLDQRALFILASAVLLLGMAAHTAIPWQVVVLTLTAVLALVAVVARRLAARRVRRWLELHAS